MVTLWVDDLGVVSKLQPNYIHGFHTPACQSEKRIHPDHGINIVKLEERQHQSHDTLEKMWEAPLEKLCCQNRKVMKQELNAVSSLITQSITQLCSPQMISSDSSGFIYCYVYKLGRGGIYDDES